MDGTAIPKNRFLSYSDPYSLARTNRIKQVWAIGGGKGGVGKSLIASSLAIYLTRAHYQVVAVDLDLGAANLHTTLGIDMPKLGLSDFISGRVKNIQDCVIHSSIPGLRVLSGAQDSIGIVNIQSADKVKLLRSLRSLDADYLIFDLGAGTGFNTLDFFLAADIGIITLLPEPTSIENAYRFIKSSYYRRLALVPSLLPIRDLVETAMDSKNTVGIHSPSDLFREVNHRNPDWGMRLKEEIQKIRPKLIVNQTRTQADIEIGFSIKTVCKKYFGIDVDYLGYLNYDSSVWQAIRRKRPMYLEFPSSPFISSVDHIAGQLVRLHSIETTDIFSVNHENRTG